MALSGACQGPHSTVKPKTPDPQIRDLQAGIEHLQRENDELKSRIEVLAGLPESGRGKGLYRLERVHLTRYTGFYDKDKDGRFEKLIVYIKPMDARGDEIKAIGAVDVELWDLDRQDAQAMVGRWHTGPEQLDQMWFVTLMAVNYRLVLDLPSGVQPVDAMTVKVVFTDYMTGKVFEEQAAVKLQP